MTRLALTRQEVAAQCGVSIDTVRRAKEAGALKAKRLGGPGTKEVYLIDDVKAWLDSLDAA